MADAYLGEESPMGVLGTTTGAARLTALSPDALLSFDTGVL
jgi:hypothetical protein